MTVLKTAFAAVIIGIVLLLGFEFVSPTLTARTVNNAAQDVAGAAASKQLAERDCHKPFPVISTEARSAAAAMAKRDGVALTAFIIDASQVVHVTVAKEARSLIFKHINGLRKRDEITRSATAGPGVQTRGGTPCP